MHFITPLTEASRTAHPVKPACASADCCRAAHPVKSARVPALGCGSRSRAGSRFGFTALVCCLILLGAMVHASGLAPTVDGNSQASEAQSASAKIFVITDLHYLAKSMHDEGSAFTKFVYQGDGKNTEYIHEILEAFELTLQKEKPDILLVTGDLTLNGERASHAALALRCSSIEKLGIKVYVLPGNHDILNPWARSFSGDRQLRTDSVDAGEFRALYREQGFSEALSKDRESLSYVVNPVPGLRIFMLDSCRYNDNLELGYPEAGGGFSESTLAWLNDNLEDARAAGDYTLIALHHSLIEHNPHVSKNYTIDSAVAVLALLGKSGIPAVLSGHIHIQDICVSTDGSKPFYDIATNALAVYPHHFGVIDYSPGARVLS